MTSPPNASGRQPFERLQNRWYNSLTHNLRLNRALFQIRNAANPVVHSNEELWDLVDVVPPRSLTFHSPAKPANRFSAEYISLVSQLQQPEGSALKSRIGEENYRKWQAYLSRIDPPPPAAGLPALFRRWSMLSAPSVMAAGVSSLSQASLTHRMYHGFEDYRGPTAKTIDFSLQLAQAREIVAHSTGFDFAFQSRSATEDVQDTWTRGVDDAPPGLWSGEVHDPELCRRFAEAPVEVAISARSYAVCTVVPGSWYSSALLHTAYSTRSGPPWPENPSPTWEERFGPGGTLRRAIIALTLADGLNATIRSGARLEDHDRLAVQRNAPSGVWPLFIPDRSGEASNTVTFDENGAMRVRTVTTPGTLMVLGNDLMEIGEYLAHAPS